MVGKLKILETNPKSLEIVHLGGAFIVMEMSLFGWGVLKCRVLNSVRFCIGDLPM